MFHQRAFHDLVQHRIAGRLVIGGSAVGGTLRGTSSAISNLATGSLEFSRDGIIFENTSTPPIVSNLGTIAAALREQQHARDAGRRSPADPLLAGSGAGQFAQVQLVGNASIAGQLMVTRLNSYTPTPGTTFPILTFGSRSGTFTSTAGLGLYNGDKLAPTLGANSLTLEGVRSALGNWMDDKFGANAGNPLVAGPMATPAGDGIPNALKYAFNLDPMLPGTSGLPKQMVLTEPKTQQHHLGLSFRRRMNATDPLYFPRVSNGLDGAWDASGAQLEFVGTPMQPGGKAFLDLEVDYE